MFSVDPATTLFTAANLSWHITRPFQQSLGFLVKVLSPMLAEAGCTIFFFKEFLDGKEPLCGQFVL
jgi:hypothetical protein